MIAHYICVEILDSLIFDYNSVHFFTQKFSQTLYSEYAITFKLYDSRSGFNINSEFNIC